MRVLSLFDGISCGKVALENLGIKVEKYFASEINPRAIQISKNNHPDIIQLGDITKLSLDSLPAVDIVIGGSPCQDLSVYKTSTGDRDGLEGRKSNLFYHYERILNHVKPKNFFIRKCSDG